MGLSPTDRQTAKNRCQNFGNVSQVKQACRISRKVSDSTRSYKRMYVQCTGEVVFGGKPKTWTARTFNWLGPWLFSDSGRSAEHSFAMNP